MPLWGGWVEDLLKSHLLTLPDARCSAAHAEVEQIDQRCLWPATTRRFIPTLSSAVPQTPPSDAYALHFEKCRIDLNTQLS